MTGGVDLSRYDNQSFSPGRGKWVLALWFFFGLPLLRCAVLPSYAVRRGLLRLFGARVGVGVVIKPGVRIKYPWRISIGDHAWLGEDCWIDNLVEVEIGAHACVSQGAYLCTGNHDWSDPRFRLFAKPVKVGAGAWICARATIGPGVTVGDLAVLTAGSVTTADIPARAIYSGNPAVRQGTREIRPESVSSSSQARQGDKTE